MKALTIKKTATIVTLATLVAFSSQAAKGALSGAITLTGVIAAQTSITVIPEAGYDNLDLTQTANDLKVATVVEKNNTAAGYSVSLVSANAGNLKNGSFGSIAYSAKYNGQAVSLSTTPQQVSAVGSQSGVVNAAKDFQISYTGVPAETVMAGAYSDTLTFTIQAN